MKLCLCGKNWTARDTNICEEAAFYSMQHPLCRYKLYLDQHVKMVCLRLCQLASTAVWGMARASSHQYAQVVDSQSCLQTGISEQLDDSVSSVSFSQSEKEWVSGMSHSSYTLVIVSYFLIKNKFQECINRCFQESDMGSIWGSIWGKNYNQGCFDMRGICDEQTQRTLFAQDPVIRSSHLSDRDDDQSAALVKKRSCFLLSDVLS